MITDYQNNQLTKDMKAGLDSVEGEFCAISNKPKSSPCNASASFSYRISSPRLKIDNFSPISASAPNTDQLLELVDGLSMSAKRPTGCNRHVNQCLHCLLDSFQNDYHNCSQFASQWKLYGRLRKLCKLPRDEDHIVKHPSSSFQLLLCIRIMFSYLLKHGTSATAGQHRCFCQCLHHYGFTISTDAEISTIESSPSYPLPNADIGHQKLFHATSFALFVGPPTENSSESLVSSEASQCRASNLSSKTSMFDRQASFIAGRPLFGLSLQSLCHFIDCSILNCLCLVCLLTF